MKKIIIAMLASTTFAGAQSWTNWDESTSGTSTVTGTLGGIDITLTSNATRDGNLNHPVIEGPNTLSGNGFGQNNYPGDQGLVFDPNGGVDRLDLVENNIAAYTFSFGAPLVEDIFFHWTGGDQNLIFTGGTIVSHTGGTISGGDSFAINPILRGTNAGGGTLRILAGTTQFTAGPSIATGDDWHATLSTVPEPSALSLGGFGIFGFLLRRKR